MKLKDIPYDESNPKAIEEYAMKLKGETFYDILKNNFEGEELVHKIEYYNNPRGKGTLGNLLEEYYFYYLPNSDSEPDFAEANVELKVTPYEINSKNQARAGERLVIGMIPNREPIETDFFQSHLLKKMETMLLVLYKREKEKPRIENEITFVQLFSILSEPCQEDLEIILHDYEIITNKIVSGRAHELSESDTKYLGACTKGATAKSSLQQQYYNEDVPAKRRAFSLKQSYMTYVINRYVLNNVDTSEPMFTAEELRHTDFDTEVIHRIRQYIGFSEESLYEKFEIDKTVKSENYLAVCRMLGVKSDRIEEFEKANIKIKTIRVNAKGNPKESMSFPTIRILDFVKEDFEDSELYQQFSETRYLFVVFCEREDGKFYLSGARFWNMPIMELETIGKEEYELYQKKFIDGVQFKLKQQANGIVVKNDLPKSRDTKIFHLRPHTAKSAYEIHELNYFVGDPSDMDELPNGDKMTKQCFWLNKDYVKSIIEDI